MHIHPSDRVSVGDTVVGVIQNIDPGKVVVVVYGELWLIIHYIL